MLPRELMFADSKIDTLPDSRRYLVRNQPNNASSFVGGETMRIMASGAGNDALVMDTKTARLNFRVAYTAGTAATDYSYLLGSAYSLFDNYRSIVNGGTTCDEINSFGVVANTLINSTFTRDDLHAIGQQIGKHTTYYGTNVGHAINRDAVFGKVFNYSIPVIGVFGQGTSTYIPLGKFSDVEFQYTLDNVANFMATGAGTSVTGFTISDVELTYEVVELSQSARMTMQQIYPSVINIKTRSFVVSNSSQPASTSGTVDVVVGHRKQSLKNIIAVCVPTGVPEKKYGSVNPNLTAGTAFLVNSQYYPTNGLDVGAKPEQARYELQKAVGNSNSGNISRPYWYRSSAAHGLFTAFDGTNITSDATAIAAGSMFYFGVDLETIPHRDSMLNGKNINSNNIQFHAVIGTALAAVNHTLYFISEYDAVLQIDQVNRLVTYSS